MFRVASSNFFGIFWHDTVNELIVCILASSTPFKNHMIGIIYMTYYDMLDTFYWKKVRN